MAQIELVVTDLDGTLWGADEVIHVRTLAALRTLQERAVPLLVATGRRPRSASVALARSGLTPPSVFLDGALGRHLQDERVFHQATFEPADALATLAAYRSQGLDPCVYVDRADADVVVGRTPGTHPGHIASIGQWLATDDLDVVCANEPILGFGVVGRDAVVLRRIAAALAGSPRRPAEAALTLDPWFGGATLMARPHGISKWDGVAAYCAEQGLDPAWVLAVGDGENDVELLTGARVACVVSNGCDAALALADHVIEPPDAAGWCTVLDLVGA